MAKYSSPYPELGFYVNGKLHRFNEGIYKTEDPAVIKVLEGIAHVKREDAAAKPEEVKPEGTKQDKSGKNRKKTAAK